MSRFAILVVSAFLLRAALESRESEMETHLGPESGSEEAADPAAASGSEEDEDSAADVESESGSEEEAESAPATVPCEFEKQKHSTKVLKKMLERVHWMEFGKKKEETRCTSMNISKDDKCCEWLQELGKSLKGMRKDAKNRAGDSAADWCNKVSPSAKWSVSNEGKRMHEPCKKHTDCVQEWWTNGMACAMGSSPMAFANECRLCHGSKRRHGICETMTGREQKECRKYHSCKDDSQCATPFKCKGTKKVCKKA
mmetsp:Transcript_28819/g.82540  ORF Transcript_28819/g.82540 Transcript_28819/m.82540 type:complete len:255 (-) Transcript_28819:119-883(-)